MLRNPDEVYRLLVDSNPWWSSGKVPSELAHSYRRRDFYVIRGEKNTKPIVALGGPRQVGKSTVLFQLIEDLLTDGVNPSQILFVNLDLPGLGAVSTSPINDCLNVYQDRILGTSFRDAKPKVFVFLDEVTKIEGWHRDLKGWFDFRYPLKFFVSSSSNSELRDGASKSLAGRISTHLLMTWKFVDVLMYLTKDDSWNDVGLRLREAFESAMSTSDPRILERKIRQLEAMSTRKRSSLKSIADRYLLIDGFPELLTTGNVESCAPRLREYLSLTLSNDLYRFFQIRATRIFEDLLGLLARESGQLVSYRNLAELLHTEERTIVEYLEYLEGVFLASQAQYFSESRAKRIRRQRKAYVPNPGIRNAILGRINRRTLGDTDLLGPLVEGVVHDHTKRLVYCLNPGPTPEAFYWRDRQNREVDVVVRIGGKPLPIEVKYRNDPKRGLEGMESFLRSNAEAPFGLVVTRDHFELRDRVLFIPLFQYMLMV
jgi:hypothetical protein